MSSYSAKFADSCSCLPPKKVCGGDKTVVPNYASRTFVSQIGIPVPSSGLSVVGTTVGLFPFTEALDDLYKNDLFIASTDTTSPRYGAIYINRAGRYKIQVDVAMFYQALGSLGYSLASLRLLRDGLATNLLLGAKAVAFVGDNKAYIDINAVYNLKEGDLLQLWVATDENAVILANNMSAISIVQVGYI